MKSRGQPFWDARQSLHHASETFVIAGVLLAAITLGGPIRAERLTIVGSENLARFLQDMAPDFHASHPGIELDIEPRASTAGPPALLSGRAQLATMSRPMNDDELRAFEVKLGREPLRLSVAIDALAIFVNEENPLERITIEELDAIFSRSLRCGGAEPITRWGQLGLSGEFAEHEIGMYGHPPSAGTYAFFRKHALCGGSFTKGVRRQPAGRSVILSLAETRYGIGYSARADRDDGVHALAVARKSGERYGTIAPADVYAGRYPLTRDLYLYRVDPASSKPATKPEDAASTEQILALLRYVLSEPGQNAVNAAGFLALPPDRIAQERETLK